jgi:hypothetical protein
MIKTFKIISKIFIKTLKLNLKSCKNKKFLISQQILMANAL